jgi:site-specific recombinase XerD
MHDSIRVFEKSLRSRDPRKAEPTIEKYLLTARQLTDFLEPNGMPTDVGAVQREHVEAFQADQLLKNEPSTAATKFAALQQFFKFLVSEGDITVSPMANMKAPRIPDVPVPVVADDALHTLFKSVSGTDFVGRRDEAVLRVLLDTGVRISELVGLEVSDLDMNRDTATVRHGKGNKMREVPFGPGTALSLERYLKLRNRDPRARRTEALWIGTKGAMTSNGIRQMVKRRSEAAGLGKIKPHQFRHTNAHLHFDDGGSEQDLMRKMGWASPAMGRRYAASTGVERAIRDHQRRSIADRY